MWRGLIVPILTTYIQANLLIYIGGGGVFVLLAACYFGTLVTFFFPKNPLIRKGKGNKESKRIPSKQKINRVSWEGLTSIKNPFRNDREGALQVILITKFKQSLGWSNQWIRN